MVQEATEAKEAPSEIQVKPKDEPVKKATTMDEELPSKPVIAPVMEKIPEVVNEEVKEKEVAPALELPPKPVEKIVAPSEPVLEKKEPVLEAEKSQAVEAKEAVPEKPQTSMMIEEEG